MAVNRELCRDKFASLLEDDLVTTDEIVEAVYNRKVDDPGGKSPIVVVLSAGSNRPPNRFGRHSAEFLLEVQIWVLYSDPDATPAWTEALAEDRLDLIEKGVAEVIENNSEVSGFWDDIDYDGQSVIADVAVRSGEAYLLEKIPVRIEIY
ncbi:MAG: hypothetical protein AMJ88_13445 [Anaerolineae bacterium SM23_ 63]|nr:MAG: hypothetical protein AMJ88_13445 [Anaerolineae bacterium SM23_ 63]